ncbi:MAG: LPXTG cell wall anchor domain-containing protein [Clostridia bacterium]|nr:LPXTG cell wall anchor domain-containing protein [Clostridia bacterium]
MASGGCAEYNGTIPETITALLNNGNFTDLTFDMQTRGRGNSYIILMGSDGTGRYEAHYTFGGELSHYDYTYADGCAVSYSREGDIFMGDHFKTFVPGVNGTLEWTDGEWKRHVMGPNGESWESVTGLPDSLKNHNPEASHTGAPKTYAEVTPYMPPQNVMDAYDFGVDYETLKTAAKNAFPATYKPESGSDANNTAVTIEGTEYKGFVRQGKTALVKTNTAYGTLYAIYSSDGKLYEVYAGTLCFNVKNNWCVMAGHPKYGAFTRGFYDWETGKLEEFLVETPDKELTAGYTNTNVLQSYEIWSRTEGRWEFWDGQWAYSPDSRGSAELEPTDPTEEVLKKILRVPGVAEYEGLCVTSASGTMDKPFLLTDKSTINNATMKIESNLVEGSQTKTKYKIKLDDNGTSVQPTKTVTLSLPYPNGMTPEIAQDYGFAVVHEKTGGGTDKMSSVAGSVTLTDHGLEVETDSFSPFTVDWGKKSEIENRYPDAIPGNLDTGSLPQTGDASNLPLLLAVLAASACALALVLRKRSMCR